MKKFIPILENFERRSLCSVNLEVYAYDIGATKRYLDQLDPVPPAPVVIPTLDPQVMNLPLDGLTPLTVPVPDPSDAHMTILLGQTASPVDLPLMPVYFDIATEQMLEYMRNMNPYDTSK